jgi:cytoskeletal protein CcmA (bactofilin family)
MLRIRRLGHTVADPEEEPPMRTINTDVQGPTILRQDTRLNGVVTGDVTVPAGVRLELNGTVKGNLLACPGSHSVINGAVLGHIFNEGGEVEIFGLVGVGRTADVERCYVHPTASVGRSIRH